MTSKTPPIDRALYERATRLLPWMLHDKVRNVDVRPHWIAGTDSFSYAHQTPAGREYVVVDAVAATRRPAFNHVALAALLSEVLGRPVDPQDIPAQHVEVRDLDGREVDVHLGDRVVSCDLSTSSVASRPRAPASPSELTSPNGRLAVFARGGNLYLRDRETASEQALTTDGTPSCAYGKSPDFNNYTIALDMAGRAQPFIGTWSPDGTKVFTHRLDERHLDHYHLLQTVRPDGQLRPKLYSYRFPLAGEAQVALWEPVLVDVGSGSVRKVELPATDVNDHTPEEWLRVQWSRDSRTVWFITTDRAKLRLTLHELDTGTGAVRTVLEQVSDSYQSLTPGTPRVGNEGRPNIRFLEVAGEFIWYSDTGPTGALELRDLKSGALKNAITGPPHVVRDIIGLDDVARRLWFTASGGESGRDPYYRHLYCVGFDGTGLTLLTPEDAEHDVFVPSPVILAGSNPGAERARGLAPSGRFFVDTCSRVDRAPASTLRRADTGAHVMDLDSADTRGLTELGWRWPEPFRTKAADGRTDLYGVAWRPSWADGAGKLPVILIVYPGPQIALVPKASFKAHYRECFSYTFCQSLAELGFIVVMVDPRGTALRERAFRLVSYGNLGGTEQHEDYVATLRQLALRDPQIDLDRVGIHGHSGGGFSTVRAMLTFPDFFKVGVASAGDHDLRCVSSMWVEAFQGPSERHAWERLDNAEFAGQLKGKLLLAYSDMDECVHYGATLRLVDALVRANKDFDLLILPNAGHDFAATSRYFLRRLWDYFVRHLQGVEPPPDFEFPMAPW